MGIADPYKLTPEQMDTAKKKLIDLKHNILSFYTTPDEALQLWQNNDVAVMFANYGQQQVKTMKDAGLDIVYVNPKEGAIAWLDTWALTSGVRDKELAESWINFVLQKKIGEQLSQRTGFGNTVAPFASAGEKDTMVWIENVEDSTKRADLWNEIKAAP
jgi:putative spermidine/putrescine transport system substrate-binding protein